MLANTRYKGLFVKLNVRNSILRTVSVMYTLNREMDNVYVTDSYWQKQQQTLVVKRRAGMMDSYLCFNLYTSKCQCAKNNKSKERTLIITDSSSTVGVFLRICCGPGNDKFYYRLEYIKNLVPASSRVGGLSLYVWNSESLDFDYNSRRRVIR